MFLVFLKTYLMWSCQPAPFGKRGKRVWKYISIVTIWTLWEECNRLIFQDKRRVARHVIEVISLRVAFEASSLKIFHGISTDTLIRDIPSIIHSAPHVPQSQPSWQPPNGPVLKLSFDGCSLSNPVQSGIGGIFRDHYGVCIQAFSNPLPTVDAITAEIKALLFGLQLVHTMGIQNHLVVEGDSVIVIGWMKKNMGPWRLSHLVNEAPFLVMSMNISFIWILREANSTADGLAKSVEF